MRALAFLLSLVSVVSVSEAEELSASKSAALLKKLDLALERFYAHDYKVSTPALYEVFRSLPESELKRDIAEFSFAQALASLGFTQGAVEHFVDIVAARRSPDLVGRSLAQLDEMVRNRRFDERQLIDSVLFGNQFGDLSLETGDFVDYFQALGELQRGYVEWGVQRLEILSKSDRYYGWKARLALATQQLSQGNDDGAEKRYRALADGNGTPRDIKNEALLALARMEYERKRYEDAFATYNRVDAPVWQKDYVLLESAWDRVAGEDEKRALGMVVGLGAPIYRRMFVPEKWLIDAFSFNRLCQFRAAHLEVGRFKEHFRDSLRRIKERRPFAEDPILSQAVAASAAVSSAVRWRELLVEEKKGLGYFEDKATRDYLSKLYDVEILHATAIFERGRERAYKKVADELLRVDEQMSILDYEIGVGLFRRTSDERNRAVAHTPPPADGEVRYKFDGEYWTDELQDYSVFTEDRCVR
jgi:hypothetical protein